MATSKEFCGMVARIVWTGLCDAFMYGTNRKVWAYDPSSMNVGWMGERVATVDLARVLRDLVLSKITFLGSERTNSGSPCLVEPDRSGKPFKAPARGEAEAEHKDR